MILSGGDAITRGSSPAVGPSGISTLFVPSAARVIGPAAKAELQAIVRELARGGTAVILISSELEEVRQMADRILVFRSGRIAGEFSGAGATDQQLMSAATT